MVVVVRVIVLLGLLQRACFLLTVVAIDQHALTFNATLLQDLLSIRVFIETLHLGLNLVGTRWQHHVLPWVARRHRRSLVHLMLLVV